MTMDGIINLNKPAGMTSHDCVAKIRRLTGMKRVGHTGTLDPNATGVLPVCIGGATRIVEYLEKDDKTYRCTLRLGLTTDTQDIWGNVLSVAPEMEISPEQIRDAILSFRGNMKQVPPMYSAIKVGGRKLYEYAREGKEVPVAAREINIHDVIIHRIEGMEAEFTVMCSKGTYIRTLCHDIGTKLGCGGAMASLVRTGSGMFQLENSISLQELAEMTSEEIQKTLAPADKPLEWMPSISLDKIHARHFIDGKRIDRSVVSPGLVRVYFDGVFLGVGKFDSGKLKAHKVFNVRLQNETL